MILQKVYQDGRMSYRGYMNGKVAWDQSVYTRGHATAAALGFAMAQMEKPLSIQMCAAASTVLNGCAIITGFAPEMKAEGTLTGTAEKPDVQEPEKVQMAAGGVLQAFAMGYTYGIVYADLCHAEGVLTSNVMAHTAGLVYGMGNAMCEGTGFAMPGLADLLNLILSASAETAGTAVAQIQAPEKVLMAASAELSASCCPVTVPVYTVTFMHNGEVLHTEKVLEGYNCPDPVAEGVFDAPTKEMTAQYTYEYSGWTRTEGGTADSSALTNITADIVVYAAFAGTVRKYTITYYDDDGVTVLSAQSLAYGSTPSYVPIKTDYAFDDWYPEVVPVTGNASYYASWVDKIALASADWATIAELSESGKASRHFAVGDKKYFTFNGINATAMIVGFAHDDLADGSGKAGITFVITECITPTTKWYTSNYNTTVRYNTSTLHMVLNSTAYNYLSDELRPFVKNVAKKYQSNTKTAAASAISTVSAYLWALAYSEMYSIENTTDQANLGGRYQGFYDGKLSASSLAPSNGNKFWLRSCVVSSNAYAFATYYTRSGGILRTSSTAEYTSAYMLVFGFCI